MYYSETAIIINNVKHTHTQKYIYTYMNINAIVFIQTIEVNIVQYFINMYSHLKDLNFTSYFLFKKKVFFFYVTY